MTLKLAPAKPSEFPPRFRFGYGYRVRLLLTPDESVAPLSAPEIAIPVREMIVESKRATS